MRHVSWLGVPLLAVLIALAAGCGSGPEDDNGQGTQRTSRPSVPPLSKEQIEAARKAGVKPLIEIDLGGGVTMEMVRIEAGTFMMGSPVSEERRNSDEIHHEVTISKAFYMGATEVTQAQWEAVMGNNPSHFEGRDLPVETVSWNDCRDFIGKLNERVPGGGFRLPTEAQWEYACRAGTRTAYQWGDDPNDGKGWCNGDDLTSKEDNEFSETHFNWRDGFAKTAPVGSFKPSAWGLYDMHGNVWEWCQDWYGDYPRGRVTDPTGPATGKYRGLRGGSWHFSPRLCRSAGRAKDDPTYRYYGNGFRCVWTVVTP